MIAIRMIERDPAHGFFAKRYVIKGMRFEAGDAGQQTILNGRVRQQIDPSPVYPMEDTAMVEYLTGRDPETGNYRVHQGQDPGKPVFAVVPGASDRAELEAVLQREMETRARRGQAAVKAEVRPLQVPQEITDQKRAGDVNEGVVEVLKETNLRQSAEIAELRAQMARLMALQEANQEAAKPASVADLVGDGAEEPPAADPDPEPAVPAKPAKPARAKKTTRRRKKA